MSSPDYSTEGRIPDFLEFVRNLYPGETPVPLHAPRFLGNEKAYLSECIDSTYVSYVGPFVTKFENHIRDFTGAKHAVALVNGTAALQMVLVASGLQPGDVVLTQDVTFVATANAIRHAGGEPVFLDVDRDTLGLSPQALESFLSEHCRVDGGVCFLKRTGAKVHSCIPMHTFGFPCRIEEILEICLRWNVLVIEDAAESLGSFSGTRHTGTFGLAGTLSFNGNKPVTTGGGGMLLTDDEHIAERVRHLSTTAKKKHPWEFFHDEVGWNLRMPNLNAAVGCAQMERIDSILANKRETAGRYREWASRHGFTMVEERAGAVANHWLNAFVLPSRDDRDRFLEQTNGAGVQTRPIWVLMNKLPAYQSCLCGDLTNSHWLEDRVVNVPSSVRLT